MTERHRAQELETAQRLLLMEVDHRAMNALAMVQSIVRLSCPADAPAYVGALRSRVDALAGAHRLLAHNCWSDVEFCDVVALVAKKYQHRIDAAGPSLLISAQVVQPIALVVHELLSNAVAHGALSQPDGAITIRWWAVDDRAVLSWRERGVVGSSGDPGRGVGLSMIEGVIERQLGGAVH